MSTKLLNLNPDWWYLHGKAYDFSNFIIRHPGGEHSISLGKGRDCTALFESYHTNLPNEELLNKYIIDPSDYPDCKYTIIIDKKQYSFDENGFYRTLKKRAQLYFKENNYANTKGGFGEFSTCIFNILSLLFFAYFAFIRKQGSAIAALLFGIAKALLIIRATHAASHYSFSTNATVNRIMYWVCMAFVGETPAQWTAKHVLAHHIDTNIVPQDDDTMYPIKRILPSFPRYWWHSYQHIYIWFLYSFVCYPWSISHNIKVILGLISGQIYEGCIQVRHSNLLDWAETLSAISIHHVLRILPFIFLPTWWQAIFLAILAEFSSSVWFSLQFAVNHEIEESILLSGNEKDILNGSRDWGAHQLITSHNYSPDFWLALHLSGGLNYQIEHHLFPSVHYKHYPALAKIVQNTSREFNLPYNYTPSFLEGIIKHFYLLKKMGQTDSL